MKTYGKKSDIVKRIRDHEIAQIEKIEVALTATDLGNASAMVTDWSKDRGEGDKVENFFYEAPNAPNKSWTMAYDFYNRVKVLLRKGKMSL